MESLLRTTSAKRVAILSWPSQLALNCVRKLWMNKHTVFPILPLRNHRLVHLLAESRPDALCVHPELSLSDYVYIQENLGIPVIPLKDPGITLSPTIIEKPTLFESQTESSTIPIVERVDTIRLRNVLPDLPLLPYSTNWVFDAESANEIIFANGGTTPINPSTITVDVSTIDSLIALKNKNILDVSKTESIVVDLVSRNTDTEKVDKSLVEKKLGFLGLSRYANILGRIFVPQMGGSVTENMFVFNKSSEYIAVPGLKLTRDIKGDFSVSDSSRSIVVHGDVCDVGESVTPSRKERMKKKKIMQADWRIRRVPIAVYHKKRGFKGQIYYTTKHKGWSFYKSRY